MHHGVLRQERADLTLKGVDWIDLRLEMGIGASWLGFQLQGFDLCLKGGGRMEKEKKSLNCHNFAVLR